MTNNTFTRTFTLKQHTPIIHFQHEQEGATLRATELKPKLDRFIIEKMGGKEKIPSAWFIGDTDSLNYKVKITADPQHESFIFASLLNDRQKTMISQGGFTPISPAPYFADNQHIKPSGVKFDDIEKRGILCKGDITVTFFCLNKSLLAKIEEHFETFLVLHNFGTRQSKGFGSFTTVDTTEQQACNILRSANVGAMQSLKTYSSTAEVFKFITQNYQILKSGTGKKGNDGIRQTPSKLQLHYRSKKIDGNPVIWEAEPIKECIYFKAANIQQAEGSKQIVAWSNERYIRALLGLAEEYSYMQPSIPIDKVKITDLKEEIDRFQSPITFKVIWGKMYLICHPIPDQMYDRTFVFKATDRVPLHINTPPDTMKLDLPTFLAANLRKDEWKKL